MASSKAGIRWDYELSVSLSVFAHVGIVNTPTSFPALISPSCAVTQCSGWTSSLSFKASGRLAVISTASARGEGISKSPLNGLDMPEMRAETAFDSCTWLLVYTCLRMFAPESDLILALRGPSSRALALLALSTSQLLDPQVTAP